MIGPQFGPLDTPLAVRSHEEMKPVLLHPDSDGPAIHYYMIRGGTEQKNITVWQPGTIGGEYIKAFGHYHRDNFIETYTILSGTGILLLQERKIDANNMPINTMIESVTAQFVQAGDTIVIPKNAGHLLINTGDTWLVTIDNSPVEKVHNEAESAWPKHADYESIRDLKGFAYYVVSENNKPTFIKNPNYTVVPDIIIK
jgi:glucose-6-phosphate isomerase, archaeal